MPVSLGKGMSLAWNCRQVGAARRYLVGRWSSVLRGFSGSRMNRLRNAGGGG